MIMKITKSKLKQIIKEELESVLNEKGGHLARHLAKNPSLANPEGRRKKRMQGKVVSGASYDSVRDEPWLYDNDFQNMDLKTLQGYQRKIEKLNDRVVKKHEKLTIKVEEAKNDSILKQRTLAGRPTIFAKKLTAWIKEKERTLRSLATMNANYIYRLKQLKKQSKVMNRSSIGPRQGRMEA